MRYMLHVTALDKALDHVPDRVRNILDADVLWRVIAFFGVVLTFSMSAYALRQTTKETATRVAQTAGNAQATYDSCVRSIPVRRQLNAKFSGIKLLAEALIKNAAATVALVPPGTKDFNTKANNLQRLLNAEAQISTGKPLHVPTYAECDARRDALLRG